MNLIQSQINQAEARIKQFENSDYHTAEEKEKLISVEQKSLEQLYLKLADNILVTNPQIIK